MPLQNRVTPEGEVVAVGARGTMYGNRGGCFHRPDQTLLPRRFATKQWICCVLAFKGRQRALMQPRRYTELFFIDEATALAAGHRPCFECRRSDAVHFAEAWNTAEGLPGRAAAPAMDARLHGERIERGGGKISYQSRLDALPDGTLVRHASKPALVWGGCLSAWSFAGYGPSQPLAGATLIDVLTPRTIVAVLAAGYKPAVHATALNGDGPRGRERSR